MNESKKGFEATKNARAQLAKPVDLRSMTRRKARVEIARDVLAALDLGVFKLGLTSYFTIRIPKDVDIVLLRGQVDLRSVLAKNPAPCEVCAIGACLVAVVGRDDEFLATTSEIPSLRSQRVRADDDSAIKRLRRFFDADELRLMEVMFEGHKCPTPSPPAGSTRTDCNWKRDKEAFYKWGQRVMPGRRGYLPELEERKFKEARLRALMNRVIDLRGGPLTAPRT